MTSKPDWLPDLILYENYGGNWDDFLNDIYEYYLEDFVRNKPTFMNQELSVKRHPKIRGKEATFWHIVSEGKDESEIPNIRRCEAIRWPKAIIENYPNSLIKFWKNTRKGEERICLWLESLNYLVILAERRDYILFWTAYCITRKHRREKLQKEYEKYWADHKKADAAH